MKYVALLLALIAAGTSAAAAKHGHSGHRHYHYPRSAEVRRAFERDTGHPRGWKGHIVDHVEPLACGGADATSNMQWQTTADAKAKDKIERIGCFNGHR